MNQRKNTPTASLANQKSIQNSPRLQPPGLVQRKAAISPVRTQPTAPPVYRPQPLPKVLQRKAALPALPAPVQTQRTPIAPPVNRPQPLPRVLQRQTAENQRAQSSQTHPQRVAAPLALRPVPGNIVQRKAAMATEAQKSAHERSSCYRNPTQTILQMKQAKPSVPDSRIATNSHRPKLSFARPSVIQRAEMRVNFYTAEDIAKLIRDYRKAEKSELFAPISWTDIKKLPKQNNVPFDTAMKSAGIKMEDVKREWKKLPEFMEQQQHEQRGREREQKRVSEDRTYRRKESIVRLLETPDNVCTAMTELDGKLYAAANMGPLANIAFNEGVLSISEEVALEKDEGLLDTKARKLTDFLSQDLKMANYLSNIQTVEPTSSGSKHAEMKILDFLYARGKKGVAVVYISRLCCAKCRVAIDIWNEAQRGLTLDVRPGTHRSSFMGWIIPDCFVREGLVDRLLQQTQTKSKDELFTKLSLANISQRRERSLSPPPKEMGEQKK